MLDSDVFRDRWEAGHRLGTELARYLRDSGTGGRPLVLALPRGGVPVGMAVAEDIDADFDVTVARKIGMPGEPEFGVGAVTADGTTLFDEGTLGEFGLSPDSLAADVARERAEALRRENTYRGARPPVSVAGRVVVVVDDGLATGVTAGTALRAIRPRGPARLIFAAPACAAQSVRKLDAAADAVICLVRSTTFTAVGDFYRDFGQLDDEEVKRLLQQAWSVRTSG